jgi:hypothetical protein
MANIKKPIHRTEEFKVMVSKEEKDLIMEYAKSLEMQPTRIMRNLIIMRAESFIDRNLDKATVKAYAGYLKLCGQDEYLEILKNTE